LANAGCPAFCYTSSLTEQPVPPPAPPLDGKGNSVRRILACKELASHLGLHAFEFINVGSNFMQWMSN